jgi:hypothetical protein
MIAILSRRAPAACGLAAGALLLCASAWAATPPSGTVSQSSPQANWTGGPRTPTAAACGSPTNASCDNYKLTIVPPSFGFKVQITLTPQLADDYDLEVYGPNGTLVASSGHGAGKAESAILINPPGGTYTVSAAPFASLSSYKASAAISRNDSGTAPDAPPRYANHTPPDGIGQGAGEPSIGVNARTGSAMFIAGTETLRTDFDDCTSPAAAQWQDVSALQTSQVTFDPILFTDRTTGRTFVSQLLPSKVSLLAFSDNDGITWSPSQGAGINSGVDHQTIGGGPFAPGAVTAAATYPHILYYCSQDVALAQCATSLDGGVTFGPAVPIYNLTDCGGIHGHVKVAPDGTAYVPNKSCGGQQGMAVSRDNGLTWTVKTVPGSSAGEWDPSVGIASDNTLYFGWGNGDGHAWTAVSHDGGDTWTNLQDVGVALGIQNIAFPAVTAGDPDRAAFAFLGTPATGDVFGEDPTVPAVWHLYVAHTYDGGATWTVSDATPDDPVQRGPICSGGTLCGTTRNLLDFMDATFDAKGRVLVAYADGCVGGCAKGGPNSGTARGTIARQMSGRGLLAAYDEPEPALPAAPAVAATRSSDGVVHLGWSAPDDNGAQILGYHIYRKLPGGISEQLQGVSGDTHAWEDTSSPSGATYRVKAANGMGEGPACREVAPVAAPPANQACAAPGVLLVSDAAGDSSSVAALDVLSLAVAEPPASDGSHPIVFTLKVADLSSFTAGSAWMILWNRPVPDADFDRNYVVMRATGPGTAAFKYGKISPPNANQGTDLGDVVGSFSPDGTITITITPDKADNVATGEDLSAIEVRTFAANVSGQPVTQLSSVDHTGSASYTLVGNAVCGSP